MIRKSEPLSMAEAGEYIKKEQENLKGFVGKFIKLNPKQAKEMRTGVILLLSPLWERQCLKKRCSHRCGSDILQLKTREGKLV